MTAPTCIPPVVDWTTGRMERIGEVSTARVFAVVPGQVKGLVGDLIIRML